MDFPFHQPNFDRIIRVVYAGPLPEAVDRTLPERTWQNARHTTLRITRYDYEMCMLPRAVLHEALLAEMEDANIKWGMGLVGIKELERGGIVRWRRLTWLLELMVYSVVKDYLLNGQYQSQYEYVTHSFGLS